MPGRGKINILVVDDLPEKRLVMESVLAELDENIVCAGSGSEALQLVLRHEFAVILLDVNMPDMDGYETAAYIRQRKRSARTPIIFITAYADEVQRAQGYSLGAVDYILSPVVPEILRTKVRVFVDLFRMTEEVRRHADERIALAAEQAARAAAEETNRRLAFLANASTTLASSLDFEATVRNLARVAVPFLADFCAVSLMADCGGGPLELAWVDVAGAVATRTVSGTDRLPIALAEGLGEALVTGKISHWDDLVPAAALTEAGELPFPLQSAVILPLWARQRVLGAVAFAFGPSNRRFEPAEQALAEDLGSRAAVALDNARLYGDIREADRRKNEFLSMLAHELRNPLAPVMNAVHILRLKGPLDSSLQWARDVIERQVHQLGRLVDDLLDVSRITRGKIRLHLEPVELARAVHQAIEISRPLIDARRHNLTVNLPEEPVWVNGDNTRLAQVFANLLNNAAKYTDEGGRITVSLEQEADEAVVRVRDTGVGIPNEMLGGVFDLFIQIDRSIDRSQGGLGIGLTLVRSLVEMHGGTVRAHSNGPNQGSEFVVRLPALTEMRLPEPDDLGGAQPPANGAQQRVLVVDDNIDAADSLALLLRVAGHEVRTAHDGVAALDAAQDFQPQIILLDIGLPRLDGYEVARRLRSQPETADALLIAITGYGQEEDQRRSREAGFDYHLVKPVDPETLEEILARPSPNGARADKVATHP